MAALRVWQLGDVTGGQHLGVGDPQLGKWRMVRRDVGRLAFCGSAFICAAPFRVTPLSMRSSIWIGIFIGSTIGGLSPEIWGGDMLSYSGGLDNRHRNKDGEISHTDMQAP